jgi:hypothetical protein
MPLGNVAASLILIAGVVTSLYISLDTHYTANYVPANTFTHPRLCSSGDVAFDQTGSPYPVRLPNRTAPVLAGSGPPCLDLAAWVHTHLNYWHLLLNTIFWTYIIYIVVLIPAHTIKWSVSKARGRRVG